MGVRIPDQVQNLVRLDSQSLGSASQAANSLLSVAQSAQYLCHRASGTVVGNSQGLFSSFKPF